MPRSYSTANRQAQTTATQQRIVDAVEELLLEVGPDQVTLKGVSERSGVALATLYKHFASRTELLAAAYRTLAGEIGDFADDLASVCDDSSDPIERLHLLLAHCYDAVRKDDARLARIPSLFGVTEIERAQQKAIRRRRALLRAVLQPLAAAGQLAVPLPEAVALGALVTSPGFWGDLIRSPELSRDQAIDLGWTFLTLNVLLPSAQPPSPKPSPRRAKRARTA